MNLKSIKKILVIRTDRIGDVLLSTPALANLRKALPKVHIAIMVRPYAREIVEGNPNINEVIIYDKKERHKGWLASLKFALALGRKRFDLALVLHPTNRAHIIAFLAGIKTRIGYNKNFPFLLTKRIVDLKFKGERHERDYVLDMVSVLGIEPKKVMPFMPIREDCEMWAKTLLSSHGLNLKQDRIVAVHPGASCPSKRWPPEYFVSLSQCLLKEARVKIVVVSDQANANIARKVIEQIRSQSVIDLVEKTSLSQLASLLKHCSLFISNDSGPVHIASALGTPVIAIFGRNQAGLSPRRWGPLGEGDKILHKEVGCEVCLAHNCDKDFLCLKAIRPEQVCHLAKTFL